MKPFWSNGLTTLHHGDSRQLHLPDESVHCVVTSPPYFGLRVYSENNPASIGLEPTAEEYIASLVQVFREVRRTLRSDGVLWLNLGDSYSGARGDYGTDAGGQTHEPRDGDHWMRPRANHPGFRGPASSLPNGNRLGIPERVVLALQRDGWIWRDQIVWAKVAPMPESIQGTRWERCRVKVARGQVGRHGAQGHMNESDLGGQRRRKKQAKNDQHPTDRRKRGINGRTQPRPASEPEEPTTGRGQESWRAMTNLEKPQRDFHHDRSDSPGAVWKDCPGCPKCRNAGGYVLRQGSWRCTAAHEMIFMLTKRMGYYSDGYPVQTLTNRGVTPEAGANRRSVWKDIRPEPYHGEHYAAFPSDLPRLAIQASTSVRGVCPECGSQWARMIDRPHLSVGWRPTCLHQDKEPVPATVLDPFVGSGRTCLAAQQLGIRSIGVDLNQDYLEQAKETLMQPFTPPLGLD